MASGLIGTSSVASNTAHINPSSTATTITVSGTTLTYTCPSAGVRYAVLTFTGCVQIGSLPGTGLDGSTPKVAAELRSALQQNIRNIDSALEAAAHAALTAAGELEGWQRWRADQIREELVGKAEALLLKPLGGRKQQDTLRHMRDLWKTSDQGGTPNQAL